MSLEKSLHIYLSDKMNGSKPTMALNPCDTRWNSWFFAVQYHREHFTFYREFLQAEIQVCGRSAPASVETLNKMLEDPECAMNLHVQLNIVSDKCKVVLQMLDLFQSRRPVTTKVFDYLEDLQMNFVANKELSYEVCSQYFSQFQMPHELQTKVLHQVEAAFTYAEEKLMKYMQHGQPGIDFLKEVRIFDPRCLAFMNGDPNSYKAIPGFCSVPEDEMTRYMTKLGPEALRASVSGIVDLDHFWVGLQDRLPVLSELALRYKDAVSNSADAERSNSIYKLVLSNRRRSSTTSTLKYLVFLYFNQKIDTGLLEREDV